MHVASPLAIAVVAAAAVHELSEGLEVLLPHGPLALISR